MKAGIKMPALESSKNIETYFFDTYALIEIIKGSENYRKYTNSIIITTLLNLMELHYSTMKDLGNEKAVMFFNELKKFAISFDENDILNANYFKRKQNVKGKKISYIDALGYIISLKNNVKFLTSDMEFADIENVEYVKG